MTDLVRAANLLARGDWQAAHVIVQDDETPEGCWAHGIVHILEGDLGNADYWYRRAGRRRPGPERVGEEIETLRRHLGGAA
jgi:hypothetical protein